MSTIDSFGELTHRAAERWIAAALAKAAALHEYDGALYPHDPARIAAAEHLHQVWREWSDDAYELLRRIKSLGLESQPTSGFEELSDEVGYARCLTQLSPAEANRRRQQIEQGNFVTLKELRSELQLRHRG